MCDSFPAISAEQLTKAVNLAAAGTLSALDGVEEDPSEKGDSGNKKNGFDNGPCTAVPATSKSSLQPTSGSPKVPNNYNGDMVPSTSFYGRARKISTKKKPSENKPATSGKKYSRKNYKLAPPLIPNEIRSAVKDAGAQLVYNSHVVKINQATINSCSSNSNMPSNKGINTTVGIRPVTLIHSPQLPHSLVKSSQPESNSLLSSILQSPPRDFFSHSSHVTSLQKSPTDGPPTKKINLSSSPSPHTEPLTVTTTQIDKFKSSDLVPLSKSDSVFRVPFPVTFSQSPSTATNTLQIVRLANTSMNSNQINVSSVVNSSPALSSVCSNLVLNQTVLNKDKPKSTINKILLSPSHVNNKLSLSSSDVTCAKSTGSSQVVTAATVSTPKSFTVCHTLPSSIRQALINADKSTRLDAKAAPIISLPHPTNLSSLTHQLISPLEKTSVSTTALHPQKSSSSPVIQSPSRYVNIRPNLIFPKDSQMSTLVSSNIQVRPVFLVTSANNINVPSPTTKTSSHLTSSSYSRDVSYSNPSVVFLHPNTNPVPIITRTTQSCIVTTPLKLQSQPEVKGIVTKQTNDGNRMSNIVVPEPPQTSSYLPLQNSPLSSSAALTPVVTFSSCQTLNLSTSVHNHSNLTKSPAVNSVSSVQSVSASSWPVSSVCPLSQPVLHTSHQSVSTNCTVSTAHPVVSLSCLNSTPILSTTLSSPGSIMPRMPLTVVKDPFTPRSSQTQNKVRLAVYPLPPDFNLPSNGVSAKGSNAFTSTKSYSCLGHSAQLSRLAGFTTQPAKDGQSISSANSQPEKLFPHVTSSTASGNISATSTSPLMVSSTVSTSIGRSGKQQLSESVSSSASVSSRKLVISPAGINQLQSLLRKMGTKEGYFIISTPRSVPAGNQQKLSSLNLQEITNSPSVCVNSTPHSTTTTIAVSSESFMKCSNVSISSFRSSPVTSDSSGIICSSTSSSPTQSETTISNTSLYSEKKTLNVEGVHLTDEIANSLSEEEIGSVAEIQELDEEESDDDDTLSSSDSSCSSNALVIETNDHTTDSMSSSATGKEFEEVDTPITSSPKNTLTYHSKEVSETLTTQNKSPSVSSTVVGLDSNITSPLSSLNELIQQHQARYGLEYQPLYSPPFSGGKEATICLSEPSIQNVDKGESSVASNVDNSEIRFPVPESPLGISCLLRHHHHHNHSHQQPPLAPHTDHQSLYDQSLDTAHTLFTHHDTVNDVHIHNSSDIEAAMNLQHLSECPAPPPPTTSSPIHQNSTHTTSSSANLTSPKSPLSIYSSHPTEPHVPLHPPMTPNTMLINLLNRVPTPLLTNHQDLLSVPSSQENDIHFQGGNQSLELSTNKNLHSAKESSSSDLHRNLENPSKDSSNSVLLYSTTSHPDLSDNAASFEQTPPNALDLIASNYLPPNRKETCNSTLNQVPSFSNSGTSSQNFTLFSASWNQGNNNPTRTVSNSHQESSFSQFEANNGTSTAVSHTHETSDQTGHCKSCCLPITITVNLDSNSVSVSNAEANNEIDIHQTTAIDTHQATASEHHQGLEQHFQDHPQQQYVFDGFTTSINPLQEKCRDTEIIRHLIMNTGSKNNTQIFTDTHSMPLFDTCNQSLQNDVHFEHRAQDSFIPTGEVSSGIHCNVSESSSPFDADNFHQRMSMPESLSQENCHESFNNLSNSESLIYDNNTSYQNLQMESTEGIETFSINSSTSITTYDTSENSVFDSTQNPVFVNAQNSTNSSFVMSRSLSDIHASFEAGVANNGGKETMPLHPTHIQSDGKVASSSEFVSNIEQNHELFFHQQSSTSQSHHPNNLHLYDMAATLHDSSHEMSGFPISGIENHDNQLQNHPECLQSSHCSDMRTGVLTNQCNLQGGGNKQLDDHPFDFSIQQNHQFPNNSTTNRTVSDASVVSFSDQQPNLNGYINEPFPSHFYTNSAASNLPMFSEQCAVGSEAPLMDSNNLPLNCSQLPSYNKNAASDMQLEFHYQPEDTPRVGVKQLVLPSASFSPPSVADPAATPDLGAMEMYNGSFQNLSAYDTYLRGGQSESRAQLGESSPESGKFCVECNIMYKTQCKFHPCDCMDISDAPILSHARLTLPPCLKLGPSQVAGHTNKTGVWAKETVAARTKFGPLVGSPVSCDQLGSTRSFSLWQTFVGSNVKVIDTSDENSSNWLMFVKPACVSSEQNLVAFQHGNRVFFLTRTDIKEGEELRYWFSKDYARMLGITSKPKTAQHQLCPHCPVCKQVFADRKQVRSHIRIQHPKPQTNKCSHCSKRFSQVSHLKAHVLAVHLNVKKFVCPHCNKKFGDSSNLRKHVKSHSDERNFKCQICSNAFRQKAHLQVHMNSHMPVKHEQCRYCGSRFTRAFERKQHELQHTKQHKIECEHCGKVFHKQKVFKEHMKIHTNERNFPCSHCAKAFRNKFALTRHGPTCKQRKRGLSLVPANPTTNTILSRHLVGSSSASSHSHENLMAGGSNPNPDFPEGTDNEDLSMNSASVSSSALSSDV